MPTTCREPSFGSQPAPEKKLLLLNARSVGNKMHLLRTIISSLNPHLILITESWCTPNISDGYLYLSGYRLFRRDRCNGNGGGCLVYVIDYYDAKLITITPFLEVTDSIWLEIHDSMQSLLLGCVYWPPHTSSSHSSTLANAFNAALSLPHRHKLIAGDFNMPEICWSNLCAPTRDAFISAVCVGGWKQLVGLPTRSKNILDLIFTIGMPNATATVTGLATGSDHKLVSCSFALPNVQNNLAVDPKYNPQNSIYSHRIPSLLAPTTNWAIFSVALRSADWEEFFLSQSVDKITDIFTEHVNLSLESSTPPRTAGRRLNAKQRVILKYARKVSRIRRMYAKTQDFSYVNLLAHHLCSLNRETQCLLEYEELKALNSSRKPTALARLLKQRSNDNICNVTHLTLPNTHVITDAGLIAQSLNEYFASNFLQNAPDPSLLHMDLQHNSVISHIQISLQDVKNCLAKINHSRFRGPDGIPPIALKLGGEDIPLLLLNIFNISLSSGAFPAGWKTSVIIPKHKGGPLDDMNSYRPINHTSICSRIFETIIKRHLLEHLTSFVPISRSQYGFLSKRSCATCQADFLDFVTSGIEEGMSIITLLLDMQKAFDRVAHKHLLYKLATVGVCPPLLDLLASYLHERQQIVRISHHDSTPTHVTSGVIQGSVLGPLLFLVYTNDVTNAVANGKTFIYADDIKIVYKFRRDELEHMLTRIQDDMLSLYSWSEKWLIKFSASKSIVLPYKCRIPPDCISIGGQHLTISPSVRDLGLRYSANFNFFEQIEYQVARARKTMGYLRHHIHHPTARLELYKICIRPVLETYTIIHGNVRKCDRLAIESVQRTFTKSILGWSTQLSYRQRCLDLRLEPLWMRRLKLNLGLVHAIAYGHAFSSSNLTKLESKRAYSLRNKQNCLKETPARTAVRQRFFTVQYATLWNRLPQHVRSASNRFTFKMLLYRYLTLPNIRRLFHINCTDDNMYEQGPGPV